MITQIFAVRDIKSQQFGNPNFIHNKGEALRTFADTVNQQDDKNLLNKHPEDFELYHLGEYNTDTGVITAIQPTAVITASEVKAK